MFSGFKKRDLGMCCIKLVLRVFYVLHNFNLHFVGQWSLIDVGLDKRLAMWLGSSGGLFVIMWEMCFGGSIEQLAGWLSRLWSRFCIVACVKDIERGLWELLCQQSSLWEISCFSHLLIFAQQHREILDWNSYLWK